MNTFFFGYLSLKWRRLVRVFLCIVISFILINKDFFLYRLFSRDTLEYNVLGIILIITSIALLSYTLKPFVVKDKS